MRSTKLAIPVTQNCVTDPIFGQGQSVGQTHDSGCAHCARRYGDPSVRVVEHLCSIALLTHATHGSNHARMSLHCIIAGWCAPTGAAPSNGRNTPLFDQILSKTNHSPDCVFTNKSRFSVTIIAFSTKIDRFYIIYQFVIFSGCYAYPKFF